ncbi:MAG TPA: ATP-binding cassette domain-containing protein, partial [Ilumatobacteraceae bacterium]|nr:ATP-binding cassette domain-containing protein [Ilumatobacteraceae bacterium]
MLEIQGLRVTYGSTVAVNGIDLTIDDGEAIALLGPNGAGKTSTLHAISRITPSKGRIVFDGSDVSHTAPQSLARRGLIHVPEGRRVFPNLTVNENLQVGQTARGGRSGHSIDDVYDLFPPLQALRKRAGWALSGGEQQRVSLARALSTN